MAAHILIVDDEPDMGHATKIKSVNSIFVATSLTTSLITLCFGIYEHRREHQFRCDILHAKLQLNNYTRSDSSIRVTVIDTTGRVLFDNQKDSPALMGNHLHRKEAQDALRTGTGLGLAIVKNIALQYGGSATASETPGVGLPSPSNWKSSLNHNNATLPTGGTSTSTFYDSSVRTHRAGGYRASNPNGLQYPQLLSYSVFTLSALVRPFSPKIFQIYPLSTSLQHCRKWSATFCFSAVWENFVTFSRK